MFLWSAATFAPSDDSKSEITTLAPARAKRSTVARPRPDAPPVTIVVIICARARTLDHRSGRWSIGRTHLQRAHRRRRHARPAGGLLQLPRRRRRCFASGRAQVNGAQAGSSGGRSQAARVLHQKILDTRESRLACAADASWWRRDFAQIRCANDETMLSVRMLGGLRGLSCQVRARGEASARGEVQRER